MTTQVSEKCQEEGCERLGVACYFPDNPIFEDDTPPGEAEPDCYYCGEHAHPNGFCWCCGTFWGGVESFDFRRGALRGLCENCISSGDFEEDEEEDMDAVYSTYPFDSEEDWRLQEQEAAGE